MQTRAKAGLRVARGVHYRTFGRESFERLTPLVKQEDACEVPTNVPRKGGLCHCENTPTRK